MLSAIAGFEWRYVARRATFAAAALALALFGFVLGATGFGAQDIPVNAPYAVAYSVGFLSLTSVFALTVLMGPALLRDTEHQMAEIVYATAVTKADYLLGRFLGALFAACAAFAGGVAGMMAGALRHEPERLAAFTPGPYLFAVFVLALPTLFFVGALVFAIAALTRSAVATYVGGVFVYVLYFASAVLTGSPLLAQSRPTTAEELAAAALADPFALAAFFEQTHYWTAAERATRGIALAGRLLANRVLWTGAAVALLAVAHRLFAFRVMPRARGKATTEDQPLAPAATDETAPAVGAPGGRAIVSTARLEATSILRSWPFLAVLVLWTGAALMQVTENVGRTEFGTALLPTAGLIFGAIAQPLRLFAAMVVVYFAGEIVWRERTARMAEIVDATPAGNAAFLVAKAFAAWLLVAAMIAVAVAVGVGVQLAAGYRPIEPAVHLSHFVFAGAPLALVALAAVIVQALAPNRYAGMLLTLAPAAYVLGVPLPPEHPLQRFAGLPLPPWSDMDGFGPTARTFALLAAYWTAVAAALAVLATALWRRGAEAALAPRLRALPRRITRADRIAVAALALVALGLGGALRRQMAANGYESGDDALARRADYERRYRATAGDATPQTTHVALGVDLFPDQRRFRVRGHYRLRNGTATAIASVPVAIRRGVRLQALTLDGRAPSSVDSRHGRHVFAVALAPGAEARLDFDVAIDRSGAAAGVAHDILPNGTLIVGPTVLPAIGYQANTEIGDPSARRRMGLLPRAPDVVRPPEAATFDFAVTAPAEQIVVAPGVVREVTDAEGGRRTTRTGVDHPTSPHLMVASARYAVARAQAGAVAVEVLHHPPHASNVPRILEAATRSLESFARRFGPYPYPQLRIAEVPAYDDRFGGFALPGVVFFTEDRGFLTDLRDARRVDIVTKRTAHEVAHQWWGHQVSPATAPGASAIVETLARYSELLVLAERHGEAALRPVVQEERRRYLSGRTGEAEVPLVEVGDQAYLYYAKGALVMMALRDLAGEQRLDGALRGLLAQAKAGDVPDAADLVDHLRAATPPPHHSLLDEWWRRTVVYDLRVASAAATPLGGGRHRVTARVESARVEVGGGAETLLPMEGAVDVAVYAAHPDRSDDAPLLVERVALRGADDLTFVVNGSPSYVAVDPFVRRIDRNPDDNVRAVELR
jgi:hypothetical protein